MENTITINGKTYNETRILALEDTEKRYNKIMDALEYDYEKAVKEDIREFISNHYEDELKGIHDEDAFEEFKDSIYDDMFVSDEVTGNASGSYTFSSYTASLYLVRNMDLYEDACEEFGGHGDSYSAETADVTIRCYLLGRCLDEVLREMVELDEEEDEE